MDFTSRLLSLFGLDFDIPISTRGDSFSPITDRLYVGVRPRAEDIKELRGIGITHVASCLEDAHLAKLTHLNGTFRWLQIPLRDSMNEDIAASFPTFFEFAARAYGDPSSKLLVHCQAGVSRSATLAVAWLMKSRSQTFFDAFAQLRSKRPGVLPNIGFASQLERLEHALYPDRVATRERSSLARYLSEVCKAPVEVELLEELLKQHDFHAPEALRALFDGEIPRVVQGVRA
ncbi:MAG: dual specificity protein phosphatase [Myxococcota bacterium]